MNIVKSYSDYYDGVWIGDADPKHTWIREEVSNDICTHSSTNCLDQVNVSLLKSFRILPQEAFTGKMDILKDNYSTDLQRINKLLPYEQKSREGDISIKFKVLIVNGIVYPYATRSVEYAPNRTVEPRITADHSFDLDTILGWVNAIDYKLGLFNTPMDKGVEIRDRIVALYLTIRDEWKADEIHIHFKSPIINIGHYRSRRNIRGMYNSMISFDTNPNLKDLGFQKVMDPHTLRQELEYYYCNILAPNEVMVEIDNDSKVKSHGFDLKTSFRKRKGSKRSRKGTNI